MDIFGEKLIIKLWDSIADKGIGSLLKPWQIRREGRALNDVRREDLLALAQAEVDAAAIRSGQKLLLPDGTLLNQPKINDLAYLQLPSSDQLLLPIIEQVADRNVRAEAIRREISLSKAVIYAEEELANETQEPSSQKVSDDWLLRWRDGAAGVCSEELQSLWGKVLAGEVKSPGRYSLRTLEFVKNISQDEAKSIEKMSPFVVADIIFRGDKPLLESKEVNLTLLLSLQELGIVSGVESVGGLSISWKSLLADRFQQILVSYSRVLMVKHSDVTRTLQIEIYQITSLGRQILSLGAFRADEDYLRALGATIKGQGFDVEIGDCIPCGENQINMFNLQPL